MDWNGMEIDLIIAFFGSLAFAIGYAAYDGWQIHKQNYILKHDTRAAIRFVVLIALGRLQWIPTLVSFGVFFCFFDYTINYVLGRPILSLGNTAKWDLFWKGKEKVLLIARITVFIAILVIMFNQFNLIR